MSGGIPIERLRGTPLVLLLDIDGTLCDLFPHADEARVPEETCALLDRLTLRTDVHVALVTGRATRDAVRMAPLRAAHIVGNHGLEWLAPGGDLPELHEEWPDAAAAVRDAAREIGAALDAIPGVWLEDKEYTLTVHFRGAPPESHMRGDAVVRRIAATVGLRVTTGKEVLNVLPDIEAHKGTAVLRLVRELDGERAGASVFFAGDDVTDEDAFRALREHVPHAVTVHVGPPGAATAAEFTVPSPAALAGWLATIESLRE